VLPSSRTIPQKITNADIEWSEGSLFSKDFNDIYFSVSGGREESTAVYLNGNDLAERFSTAGKFVIGELGFGTGLNFALTVELWKKYAPPSATLFYISYEKFPLTSQIIQEVLGSQQVDADLIQKILLNLPPRVEGLHVLDFLEYRVRLLLNFGDAEEKLEETSATVDAWYLDGFSPSKNPELWSQSLFKSLSNLSHRLTTAATYSVSAGVRNHLQELGWEIKKVPGPGYKKEILRATFSAGSVLIPREVPKKAAIIGAGLAGCALAEALVRRGVSVSLFDYRGDVAKAASGNDLGVVLPYPSRERDLRHRFYNAGFLYLKNFLKRYPQEMNGVLFSPFRTRHEGFFEDYNRFGYPAEYAGVLNTEKSCEVAGINVNSEYIHFPTAGAISFPKLSNEIVCGVSERFFDSRISDLVCMQEFDLVALTTGAEFELHPDALKKFLMPLKGEILSIKENQISKELKLPLCSDGYIFPSVDGFHLVGSTYERDKSDEIESESGKSALIQKFKNLTGTNFRDVITRTQRASVRSASRDRMPVVGSLGIPEYGSSALVISLGHGSRGGVSAFICADHLVSELVNEPSPLERTVARSISVERIGP